jgi:hypothetical protein
VSILPTSFLELVHSTATVSPSSENASSPYACMLAVVLLTPLMGISKMGRCFALECLELFYRVVFYVLARSIVVVPLLRILGDRWMERANIRSPTSCSTRLPHMICGFVRAPRGGE